MTEADRIVASLLEYEPDLDIEATVQRWKPEVRLLSTTVNARTGGKVEGFDVMLYGDKDPVYVGTIAPRGKNVWHVVHIMGNVTQSEMRQAAARWGLTPEDAAQQLIDATKRSWEPIMRYQKAWAGLAENMDAKQRKWAGLTKQTDELAKTDPHAATVMAAGGTLIRPPLPSREKWNAMLAAYAPGCGSPTPYPGTASQVPCGSKVEGNLFLCPHCEVQQRLGEATDSKAEIEKEAAKAEAPKSEEHAEAGNYQKGHVTVQGLQISIENAKGSTRSGEDKNGKPWKVTLPAHYGYIAQVGGETAPRGKDKDHIDVYIGPSPGGMMVYVVNQNDEKGAFDEHKCMLGFESKDEAVKTYDAAFTGDLGPKLRGEVVSVTMKEFKEWLKSGKTKKPFERLAESLVSKLIENVDDIEDVIDRNIDFETVAQSLGYQHASNGTYYKDVRFGDRRVTLTLTAYKDNPSDPKKMPKELFLAANLAAWEDFHRKTEGVKGWFGGETYPIVILPAVIPQIEQMMAASKHGWREGDNAFHEILRKAGRQVVIPREGLF